MYAQHPLPSNAGVKALLILAVCWPLTAIDATAKASFEFDVLVYNTHGLPSIIAGDRPSERFPRIAELTKGYELALLQEDFAHHELLLGSLPKSHSASRGENLGSQKCFVCSGSGLTTITGFNTEHWQLRTSFTAFNACSGWLVRLNDCFAQKGFQLGILESSAGHRIFLVNTHLDAGSSTPDRNARASQLNQIAVALQELARDEAIILAGDLNLNWQSAADKALLLQFRDRLQLTRAETGSQAERGWSVLDYVYFRDGLNADLEVLDSGEDTQFKNDAGPLSDHPALFVRFAVH